MNFKRNDIQEYVEYKQNCYDKERWKSYKAKLLEWEISYEDHEKLKWCIKSDTNSYFLKGLQSFTQAIHEISQKKYVWSIVKLYYASFYLLRCDILMADFIIVRCGGLFYAKNVVNNKLSSYKPNRIRGGGDHQLTVAFAKKLYMEDQIHDPILGNQIEDTDAYSWMMGNRERVNYHMKYYADPYPDQIFSHLIPYFRENKLPQLFDLYNRDTGYTLCFDLDHSILSIPYKKLIQIFNKMIQQNIFLITNSQKRKLVSCFTLLSDLNIDYNWIKTLNAA